MSLRPGRIARTGFIAATSTFICLIAVATSAPAAQLKEARVTQVINDVKLLPGQAAPRPAAVNDPVRDDTAVRTGTASRSELTFTDLTITRLGANTIFSFNEGTRTMSLTEGAILFQVPKGSGGATIRTAAVTAAITGTTGVLEYHPATATNPRPISKCLCLEGKIRLYLPNGQSAELGPGQMTVTDGTTFAKVVEFDIARFMETAQLVIGFETELASAKLIAFFQQQQENLKIAGGFVNESVAGFFDPTNFVEDLDQSMVAQESSTTPPIPPPPPPGKFGALTVIASPDPYIIGSDTVIQTDPSITTNGMTDFGKIYRGPQEDGVFSAYAFGSTSAFDTATGFDAYFGSKAPIAAFKFQSLQLSGNPTIDVSGGGATNLALIGVSGITSGPPGGTLTFSGIDSLLLATQAGSITLTSDISFQDIPSLFIYARGMNSNLTLDSAISGTLDLYLHSDGSLLVSDSLEVSQENNGQTEGLNISLRAGEAINIGDDLRLTTDARGVQNGGNIWVTSGGDTTIGGALALLVANNDSGNIGIGGNISFTTGGDLTADSIDALINNRDGGSIDSGGNMTFDIGDALTTVGDATFVISNRNDGAGGGTIGSQVVLNLTTAGNLIVGGNLTTAMSNNGGGQIAGSAFNNVLISGDLTTQGFASFTVDNTGYNVFGGPLLAGGDISQIARVALSARNVSVGGILLVAVRNRGDGHIGGDAIINFVTSANLTVGSDALFSIENTDAAGGVPGSIDGNASLSLSSSNVSVTGPLSVAILNYRGGNIGGDAFILCNVSGAITSQSDTIFEITNFDDGDGNGGGTIGGNATIDVRAESLTANSLLAQIDNSNGGVIGGSANLNFILAGDLTTPGDADFEILNRGSVDAAGGTIVSDAVINLSASNISTGGFFDVAILNATGFPGIPGGTIGGDAVVNVTANTILATGFLEVGIFNYLGHHIGGNATVNVDVSGDINGQSFVVFNIYNFPNGVVGGTIDLNATTTVVATNISSGDDFNLFTSNEGGQIGGDAAMSLTASGNVTVSGLASFGIINQPNGPSLSPGTIGGAATIDVSIGGNLIANEAGGSFGGFFILNDTGGSIGSDATISVTAANISSGGALDARIDNTGGSIGGNVTINMNVSGRADVTSDITFQILGSDGAGGAAININGGSYEAGGTFLASIDGDGTIALNNATVAADVLKVGALGANGVLNIGGGSLSADTTLKLYASGSSGQLNFISDVTLGGNSQKILAANSITIFDDVTVTIGGTNPAEVYTNNANYTGSGGNDSTTGVFAGAGANDPLPLDTNTPPFDDPPPPPVPSRTARANVNRRIPSGTNVMSSRRIDRDFKTANKKPTGTVIKVSDSGQLLSLLDGTAPGPGGKITVPASNRTSNSRNASGMNAAGRLNADRGVVNRRSAPSSSASRLP